MGEQKPQGKSFDISKQEVWDAWLKVKANKGAPGVDGQTFCGIETLGLEGWLSGISNDLRAKTYQPQAVRRVMIPKPGGGERPLGIPTIRDGWCRALPS